MDAAQLARAFFGSCHMLGLSRVEQASLLYMDERHYVEDVLTPRRLDPEGFAGRRAQVVLKLHARLDELGDEAAVRAWYRRFSTELQGMPSEMANGVDSLGLLTDRLMRTITLPG